MPERETIQRAVRTLRASQITVGTRGARVHFDAAEDNTHRLRALDGGICSQCSHLIINFSRLGHKGQVTLRCSAGFSPLELYRGTILGKTPSCPKFPKSA